MWSREKKTGLKGGIKLASKAVVRYRNRFVSRRRSGSRSRGSSRKISLGVIAGIVPGVSWSLQPVQEGRTWDETFQRLIAAYTGYSYGEKKWSSFYLMKGVAPLAGGFLAHYIADAVGINRMISRFHLPVEI